MIELFGVKLTYEAIGFIFAFTASEVIGMSKLKQNSVLQLLKTLIDSLRFSRGEDEKVAAVRAAAQRLVDSLQKLDD